MKKVLFLTNIPSPYRVAFFNELGKICDLTVVFEKYASTERDSSWKNFTVNSFTAIFLKGISISVNKAFCINIISVLRRKPYDVIIIGGYNTPTAMIASEWLRLRNVPYILNADGGYIKNDNKLVKFIKKRYISAATAWICTSEKTKEYFKYYGAIENRIYKYPFTSIYRKQLLKFPLTGDEKNRIRKQLGIREKHMIISVGQFIYRKGFDILIRAMKKMEKNIGVYIIGGNATKELLQLKERYNLTNIHFLAFMEPIKLHEYYKAADIFVLPTREDIWGLVINEAISFGLPVITTTGCIAGLELVTNGINGYIIPTDDNNELEQKIRLILDNKKLAASMSTASLSIAQKYTLESMACVHLKIIEEFYNLYGK